MSGARNTLARLRGGAPAHRDAVGLRHDHSVQQRGAHRHVGEQLANKLFDLVLATRRIQLSQGLPSVGIGWIIQNQDSEQMNSTLRSESAGSAALWPLPLRGTGQSHG